MPTNTFGQPTSQAGGSIVPQNGATGTPGLVSTILPGTTPTESYGTSTPSTYIGQDGIMYNNATNQPVNGPMLTAQVATPIASPAQSPPAVLNANAAAQHLTNVNTQLGNLNQDQQNQSASNAQNAANAAAASAPATQTPTQTQSNIQTDPAQQLNDQINSLLTNLGQGENDLDNELNTATTANNEGQQVTFSQAEQENQLQQVQAFQQANAQLTAIQSGVYPLSAPEQALLTATTNQFSQAIAQQQVANRAYSGQMAEAMASLGINQTAPMEAIGNIFGAISTGQSKIADLDSQMATSVSNLQLSFQKQDYDMVQSTWNNLSKQFDDRQSALSDMQKQVADAVQQQKTDMQQFTQTALTAINNSAQFTLTEKQDAIDNAFKQQTITETQRHDTQQEAIDFQNSLKGVYSYDASTGTVFDSRTGMIVDTGSGAILNGTATPGNTGIPIVDNNTKSTASGVPYVDGTTLTGNQASSAQLEAAKLGIPYLGSAGAAALNKIEEARENINNIKNVLDGSSGGEQISPSNGLTRLLEMPNYAAESLTQAGPESSQIAAYNTFRSAAIGALQAVAGGTGSGLRINQAEIQMSIQNDIPTPTDTIAVRNQKIANMTSLLDSNEQSLLGTKAWNAFNPTSQSAQQSAQLDSLIGGTISNGVTSSPALDSIANQYGL